MTGGFSGDAMMTSRERMLAAMEYRETDYIPCCFMLFFNVYSKCRSERESTRTLTSVTFVIRCIRTRGITNGSRRPTGRNISAGE